MDKDILEKVSCGGRKKERKKWKERKKEMEERVTIEDGEGKREGNDDTFLGERRDDEMMSFWDPLLFSLVVLFLFLFSSVFSSRLILFLVMKSMISASSSPFLNHDRMKWKKMKRQRRRLEEEEERRGLSEGKRRSPTSQKISRE